jgi:hypothetical protein
MWKRHQLTARREPAKEVKMGSREWGKMPGGLGSRESWEKNFKKRMVSSIEGQQKSQSNEVQMIRKQKGPQKHNFDRRVRNETR